MKKGGLELGSHSNHSILNQFRMTMIFAKELSSTYVFIQAFDLISTKTFFFRLEKQT